MADCVIVGAGLIGMLTARELVMAGRSVRLLDKGAGGRESSWAGGGILSPLYPWRYPDAVTALARWSQAHYPQLASELLADTGRDPEWTPSGMLMVDVSAEEEAEAMRWAERFGYRLEALTEEPLHRIEPGLGEARRGLWMPDVAQVRNPRLLQALRADLERRGVAVSENTEVTGFVLRDGRAVGIETAAGRIDAECVVVASGAWSGNLLASTGLRVPVEPVRGQMILFRGEPGMVQRIVLGDDRYVIPRRDGRILTGSTMERVGFEKLTTDTALADLRAAAIHLFPSLRDVPVEAHWAGLRPGSPTGVPFVGEHPTIEGLHVNAGHFRNGVVMGLASARLLADGVLGRPPVLDPAPYQPERGIS